MSRNRQSKFATLRRANPAMTPMQAGTSPLSPCTSAVTRPAAIGVFDSGVGGLSVLKAIHTRLPNEALHYLADSAHAPYGDRDPAFITERALRLTACLCEAGAKAIVVACNTATVVAVEALRREFTLPIIALEPAIKPAVARTRSGVVGVLATSRTLASASVARLCARHGLGVRLLLQACPGLVEQVERGEQQSKRTLDLLAHYLRPLLAAGADTLVLGCTHYPFLLAQIRAVVGDEVLVLDSAEAVACEVQRRTPAMTPGALDIRPQLSFFTSGEPGSMQTLISQLWGTAVTVQPLPERVHS